MLAVLPWSSTRRPRGLVGATAGTLMMYERPPVDVSSLCPVGPPVPFELFVGAARRHRGRRARVVGRGARRIAVLIRRAGRRKGLAHELSVKA